VVLSMERMCWRKLSCLFEVVAIAHAVVAKGGAEATDFGNDGVGGHEGRLT